MRLVLSQMLLVPTSLIAISVAIASAPFLDSLRAHEPANASVDTNLQSNSLSETALMLPSGIPYDSGLPMELTQGEAPPSIFPPIIGPRGHLTYPPGPDAMIFADPTRHLGWAIESPRRACQDNIDRYAAMAGYLKSKLRLVGSQKEAWQKIEEAADPGIESMRQVCEQLPDSATAPPPMPDALTLADRELSARVAVLRAVQEPVRVLYGLLTPEQRAALQWPLPPARL